MRFSNKRNSKHLVYSGIVVIFIIFRAIDLFLPFLLGLQDTMLGEKGLRNVILTIIIKLISGFFIAVPAFIYGFRILINYIKKYCITFRNKLTAAGILFLVITLPIMLSGTVFSNNNYDKQCYIAEKEKIFPEISLLADCISDLLKDDYNEFTINKLYLDSGFHTSEYNSEYTASFYDGHHKSAESQIGKNEYISFSEIIPNGFETKITVYKNSGFIRSVEPSVDFGSVKSYENYFTISISGDQIVYEKNVDIKIDNLQWCGFSEGESENVQNSRFGIAADSEKRTSLDSDYIGLLCHEVCLYAWVDGQYRRVSNILD